jgi:hypothetical protein
MEELIMLHVQDQFIKEVSMVPVVMVLVLTVALEGDSIRTVHQVMGMQVLHLLMEVTEAQVEPITVGLVAQVALQMTKVLVAVDTPEELVMWKMATAVLVDLSTQEQTKAIRPHSKQEMAK